MAYFRTALGEHEQALTVSPEEMRALTPSERMDFLLRHREAKATETSAKWDAVSAFATAIIPLAAFLGISSAFKIGKG